MATTKTVQGSYRPSPTTTVAGYIRAVPTDVMSDLAGNILVGREGVETALVAGVFSLSLYANDDPTTSPVGTAYKFLYVDTLGKEHLIKTAIVPYTGAATLELADLTDVTGSTTVYLSYATQAALTAHTHARPGMTKSGLYYSASGGLGTLNPTLDLLYAYPVIVWVATTIDQLACEITTTVATAVCRMGLYADDGTGYPGALLVDSGTVDASSAGIKTAAVSAALSPGLVWLAYVAQVVIAQTRSFNSPSIPIGLTALPTAAPVGYSQAAVTGALPANFTTTVTPVSTSAPRVWYRAV